MALEPLRAAPCDHKQREARDEQEHGHQGEREWVPFLPAALLGAVVWQMSPGPSRLAQARNPAVADAPPSRPHSPARDSGCRVNNQAVVPPLTIKRGIPIVNRPMKPKLATTPIATQT